MTYSINEISLLKFFEGPKAAAKFGKLTYGHQQKLLIRHSMFFILGIQRLGLDGISNAIK
jgi:hypothetical protein